MTTGWAAFVVKLSRLGLRTEHCGPEQERGRLSGDGGPHPELRSLLASESILAHVVHVRLVESESAPEQKG